MMNTLELNRFKPLTYACTEAINTLCTNLTFAGDNTKVIMFTSCQASEGKSFMTMNVMRTFASLGHKVVLVDADLRRSQIASRYGAKITSGQGMGLAPGGQGVGPVGPGGPGRQQGEQQQQRQDQRQSPFAFHIPFLFSL